MLELLSETTRQHICYILSNPNQTLSQYGLYFDTSKQHNSELDIPLNIRKGSIGVYVEQLLTGKRGDNLPLPDDGIVDIKTVSVSTRKGKYQLSNGYSVKENLRLTKVNFNTIQTTPFEESCVFKKELWLYL